MTNKTNNNMFKNFFVHNWYAILYFNFKMLPLKQAIRLPFDFYGKVRFLNLKGKVRLNANQLRTGMIKIGSQGRDMFALNPVILDIRGEIDINGYFYIGCGSTIRVEPNSKLTLGNKSRLGANSIIFCEDSITIGTNVEFSWDCQLMDTDRHEIRDVVTGKVFPSHAPIKVGDNVWVGNHVAINKGSNIPENTIVASYSLCNKDYSNIPLFSVLGGIPAKVIGSNKSRIWEQ